MARSEARLQFGIWRDGLDGLSPHAKLLYLVLLTEPTVNHAGVGAIRESRWARNAGLTHAEVEKALEELTSGCYLVMDADTEEVFVRTMIRNDGVAEQPNVLKGALREALHTASPSIRRALAAELRRLPPKQPDGVSKAGRPVTYPDPHAAADQLDPKTPPPTSTEPIPNSSGTLPNDFHTRSETPGGGGGGGGNTHLGNYSSQFSSSEIAHATPDVPSETPRDDVEQLVLRLRDRVAENEFKVPAGLNAWRKQARLLLDRDSRELEQALRLIDWATGHHFWHRNIRSMDKFRAQYDALLAQARQEYRDRRQPARRTTDDKRDAVSGLVAEVFGTDGSSALRPDLRAITGGNYS